MFGTNREIVLYTYIFFYEIENLPHALYSLVFLYNM